MIRVALAVKPRMLREILAELLPPLRRAAAAIEEILRYGVAPR